MDLITLYCIFSKGKHSKRIPSMEELLDVPVIPPKNRLVRGHVRQKARVGKGKL